MIFAGEFTQKEVENFTFPVPIYNAESIKVTLDGPFEHMFVILKDPEGKIRALLTFKTRVKSYFINADILHSTNGTVWGELPDGEWELIVVKPQHASGKFLLEVTMNEQFTHAPSSWIDVLHQEHSKIIHLESRWYRGELHAHSYYSDGRVAQDDIQQIAIEKDIDFMAIAEHSFVTTSFLSGPYTVIPATEITCDNDGHYNVYGLKEPIDYSAYFETDKDKDTCMNDMFVDLESKGYLLSINHPYAPGISLSHDFDITNFKALEVINCPYITHEYIDNPKAIRFFDYLWNNGHYLTGIGGSDAHTKNNNGEYGLCVPENNVFIEGFSIDNLLTSIEKGHVFLTRENKTTVTILENGESVLPGTEVSGEITFNVQAEKAVDWYLFENGICIDKQQGTNYQKNIEIKPQTFLRLEGNIDGEPFIFINPIHNNLKKPVPLETSFKNLVNDFIAQDKQRKEER